MTPDDLAPGDKNMHRIISMVTDDGTVPSLHGMMTLWLWIWSKEMIGLALAVSATLSLSGKDVNCNFKTNQLTRGPLRLTSQSQEWNLFCCQLGTEFQKIRYFASSQFHDDYDIFDVTLACDDEQIQAHEAGILVLYLAASSAVMIKISVRYLRCDSCLRWWADSSSQSWNPSSIFGRWFSCDDWELS